MKSTSICTRQKGNRVRATPPFDRLILLPNIKALRADLARTIYKYNQYFIGYITRTQKTIYIQLEEIVIAAFRQL
jgi:hypothetical protein